MGSKFPVFLESPGAPAARVPLPSFLGAQRDKFPVPIRGRTPSGREGPVDQPSNADPRTALPRLRSLSEESKFPVLPPPGHGRVGTAAQSKRVASRESKSRGEHAKHAPQTAPAQRQFSTKFDRMSSPLERASSPLVFGKNKPGKSQPENSKAEQSPLKTGKHTSPVGSQSPFPQNRQLSFAQQPSFVKQPSLRKQPTFLRHQPSFKVSEINEADFVQKASGLEEGEMPKMPQLFDTLDDHMILNSKERSPSAHEETLADHRRILGIMSHGHHQAGGEDHRKDKKIAFREGDIIDIIEGSLSFCERSAAEGASQKKSNKNMLFFTSELHESFEPYGIESGPIDVGKIIQFCRVVRMKRAENPERHLVYTCMDDEAHCTLASLLLAAYLVLEHQFEPRAACEPFVKPYSCPLVPFLDSSNKSGVSSVTVSDCIHALSKATKAGWCDTESFDVLQYEALSHPHGLGMNWICPKLIAFKQPSAPGSQRRIAKGAFTRCPDDYVQVFKRADVTAVIRLKDNDVSTEEAYTPWQFARHGFAFVDITCSADRMPSGEAIRGFFGVMDREKSVAVHCTSGLMSTGTLIGLYLMKELGFSADEAVAWLRIVRPGSVLGPQHDFLRSCQHRVWKNNEMKGYQADSYPRTTTKEMEKLTNMLCDRQWKRARNARPLDGDRAGLLMDLGVELSPLLRGQQGKDAGSGAH